MIECPLCMQDLNDEEFAYVESLDSDKNICFCQAAKSLAAKDQEIAQLKTGIEIKNNFIAKISGENARAHIAKDNIINDLKIALKTVCNEEGTHPEAYYKE